MMEIIKHGDTYRRENCYNCQCEFTYTRLDTHICGDVKEVKCPECGESIVVGKVNY